MKNTHKLLAIAFSPLLFAGIAPVQAQPQLKTQTATILERSPDASDVAELVKAGVVRVETGCEGNLRWNQQNFEFGVAGFGSGFFVNTEGYLITNQHVISSVQTAEYCRNQVMNRLIKSGEISPDSVEDPKIQQQITQAIEQANLKPIQQIVLSNGQRLPFTIAATHDTEDLALLKVDVQNAPTLPLGDFTQVRIAQYVSAFGYPGIVDSSYLKEYLDQKTDNEVTLTDGKVSAIKKSSSGGWLLQISAPVTHGNSGGPVLNEQGQVVGVVTFGPEESGFAFAIASESVQQLLDKAGVENDQSSFNSLYQGAVTLFRQGSHGRALSEFLKVQALFPYSIEVDRYIQRCRSAINVNAKF